MIRTVVAHSARLRLPGPRPRRPALRWAGGGAAAGGRAARPRAAEGLERGVLPVDPDGLVDPAALEAMLGPRTLLVSVGAANSEIGVLTPPAEIRGVGRRA